MPGREFAYELDDEGREWVRVRFSTEAGQVVTFTVQYESTIDGRRLPVVRYDTAHGRPHRDLLDRHGNVLEKQWLDGLPAGEVLTAGKVDIETNWRGYRSRFVEEER